MPSRVAIYFSGFLEPIDNVHRPVISEIMAQEVRIYKGDTFIANAVYRSTTGVPVDLTAAGITIDAWLRKRDSGTLDIPVILTDPTAGAFRLQTPTDDWPLGRNQLFVRYQQGAIRRTAEPVHLIVEDV